MRQFLIVPFLLLAACVPAATKQVQAGAGAGASSGVAVLTLSAASDPAWATVEVKLQGPTTVDQTFTRAAFTAANGGTQPFTVIYGSYTIAMVYQDASKRILYRFCTTTPYIVDQPRMSESVAPCQGSSQVPPTPATTATSSSAGTAAPLATGSLPSLNIAAAGNASFALHDYGATLQTNKRALAAAADAAGATAQEKALILAMAMQETTLMDISQRDASKDGTPSANCTILNLNYDMLTHLGYTLSDYGASLNTPANLGQALGYLLKGLRQWGIQSTLNYQRGGSTAFQDGTSYGAADYRNAIETIYNQIAADMTLESDSRRVEINVQHV